MSPGYGTCAKRPKKRSHTRWVGIDRSLDSDEMRTLAVVRLVEIIGEAARAVSEPTRTQFPEISWREIVGTRDRLIHGYEEVDLDILWTIVTDDLPVLVSELNRTG